MHPALKLIELEVFHNHNSIYQLASQVPIPFLMRDFLVFLLSLLSEYSLLRVFWVCRTEAKLGLEIWKLLIFFGRIGKEHRKFRNLPRQIYVHSQWIYEILSHVNPCINFFFKFSIMYPFFFKYDIQNILIKNPSSKDNNKILSKIKILIKLKSI